MGALVTMSGYGERLTRCNAEVDTWNDKVHTVNIISYCLWGVWILTMVCFRASVSSAKDGDFGCAKIGSIIVAIIGLGFIAYGITAMTPVLMPVCPDADCPQVCPSLTLQWLWAIIDIILGLLYLCAGCSTFAKVNKVENSASAAVPIEGQPAYQAVQPATEPAGAGYV